MLFNSFPRRALGPLPPAQDVAIATSTNAAYEIMKHGGQGGRQDGGHQYEPPRAPQCVKGCTKFHLSLPPSSQPLCPVEVGQRGREVWCMNPFPGEQ